MRHLHVFFIALVSSCSIFSPSFQVAVRADENANQKAIVLLKDDWQAGSAKRRHSEELFKSAGNRNLGLQKAYLLNRIFHLKNKQALDQVEGLNRVHVHDFDLWYVRCWLELSLGQFDRGLISLQSFRKKLDDAHQLAKKDPVSEKAFGLTRQISLQRMGRLLGYVETIGAEKANDTTLQESTLILTHGLEKIELDWINQQRKKVADKFNQYERKTFALKNEERIKLIEKRNREIEQLQRQSELLTNQANKIEPKLAELRNTFDDRRIKLETQADPLRSDMARLNSSIGAVESQLNFMYSDLLWTEATALRARDPIVRHRLFNQADLIALNIRNQESGLADIYGRANGVANELGVIDQELFQNRTEFKVETGRLRNELNGIQRALRKNGKRITQLSKDPSVMTGKLMAIGNRTGALRTYDQLPLESMRQQLLDSLEK